MFKAEAGSEFYLNIIATTKGDKPLLEPGHIVATEQFKYAGDYFAEKAINE